MEREKIPVPDWLADDIENIWRERHHKPRTANRVELYSDNLSTLLDHLATTRGGIGLGNFIREVVVPAWLYGHIRMSDLEKEVGKEEARKRYERLHDPYFFEKILEEVLEDKDYEVSPDGGIKINLSDDAKPSRGIKAENIKNEGELSETGEAKSIKGVVRQILKHLFKRRKENKH